MDSKKTNLVLIGMPASGKSTVGVILAKALGYDFVDTDLVIQNRTGKRLEELMEERGIDGFLSLRKRSTRTSPAAIRYWLPGAL